MPCFKPLHAGYVLRPDGKKHIGFSAADSKAFYRDGQVRFSDGYSLKLPCGRCIGCRLERSRQWAVRCTHEMQMHDSNSFITLTFSPDGLSKMSPDGSLRRKHMQDFMKRLRRTYEENKIRSFYCGEYGENLGRPHYHSILFGLDFDDKEYWKTVNGHHYYVSPKLQEVWPYGFSTVGEANFETAAYVSRYCTKKVTGDAAASHYLRTSPVTGEVTRVLPEFCQASLKPGIGSTWFAKYGMTDVVPFDEVVSRGMKAKPPRYYDKLLEKADLSLFEQVKAKRDISRLDKLEDNSYKRLVVKEKCVVGRMKTLVRSMELAHA